MILEDYVDNIDESAAFNHSVYLIESFNKWIKGKKLKRRNFSIHPELVKQVSLNLFIDLKRIKDFHNIKKEVNSQKFAAYQAAWIIRIKPIQVRGFKEKNKKDFINANELFTLYTVIARIYNTARENNLDCDELKKWSGFFKKLVYHFHHRITNPQALELTFEAIDLIPRYSLSNSTSK